MRTFTAGPHRFGSTIVYAVTALLIAGCASGLEKRFQAHIDYLASDELEGRGVGSRGIELAAEYIAKQFDEIGLEPAGDDGTYFQTLEMTLHKTLSDESRLTFAGDSAQPRLGADFIPFSFSSDEEFSGEVVFCGYGIEAPDKEHDDFVHADVSGKVVLLLAGEPPSWADENGDPTPRGSYRNKAYNAKDREAAAVLIVNQTPAEGEKDGLTEFETQSSDAYGIPAFHITRATADAQLKRAGLGSLDEIQERLDAGGYATKGLSDIRATGRAVFKRNTVPTHNVVGVFRGEGALADEFVVIGAHYDHLGIRKPMMRKFKAGKLVSEKREPAIHNGADDNASGTSGIIEIARMFATRPRPMRSIVFVAFTGEESGLHGSKRFIEQAVVPLEKQVAMLNLDMIGRLDPSGGEVQVFGVVCGEEFGEIVERAAQSAGVDFAPSSDSGGRSDNAPFVRNNIPAMHFFSGHHGDYHKPSDDSDKINARGGARIASMVFTIADELARRDQRPTFRAVKSKSQPGGTPTYRVVMGLAPGYTDDGKPGMSVDAVNSDGPADLAGMKAGDRIIRIGGKDVANIYDYMASTRKNNPGDTVEVVVLRDGKEITLQVTLTGAR